MDKKIKSKWIKALRSGKYEQTDGNLCTVNIDKDGYVISEQYCALGVLADVCFSGEWFCMGSPLDSDSIDYEIQSGNFVSSTMFPKSWLNENDQEEIANKNDCGWTFSEIAEYIEQEL